MKVIKKRAKSLNKIVPPKILSLGYYDLDYIITLSEDDMLKFHIEDVTSLKSIEDILEFFAAHPVLALHPNRFDISVVFQKLWYVIGCN